MVAITVISSVSLLGSPIEKGGLMARSVRGVIDEVYTFTSTDQGVHATHRLVAFIDAILAIAATVLVLDLRVDGDLAHHHLATQIREQLPTLLATLLGFVWIAGTWVLSHRQVRQLRGVDHYMSLFILASTLTVTLIPFATKLLAAGVGHADFWVGVEAVSVVILLSTLLSVWSARYAHARGLLLVATSSRTRGQRRPIALIIWYVIVALSVLAVLLAPFAPWIALGIIILTRISALLPLRSDRAGQPGTLS